MTTTRLQIQFRGLNEGDDPKNLPPGTLVRAENVRMDKSRRLAKRYGTTKITGSVLGGDTMASGQRFAIRGDDVAIVGANTANVSNLTSKVYSYSPALDLWGTLDIPPAWRVTRRPLVDSTRSVGAVDVAVYGNVLISLFVLDGTNQVFFQADDLTTGAPIVAPTLVSTAAAEYPRVLVSGTTAYFFYATTGAIKWRSVSLSTLAFQYNEADLVTDSRTAASTGPFDVVIATPTAGVPTLYLAYNLQAGADQLKLASFTVSTMAAITTLVVTSSGNATIQVGVAFGALSQKVSVINSRSSSSGAVDLASCSSTLTTQVGPTNLATNLGTVLSLFVVEDDVTNVLVGRAQTGAGADGPSFYTELRSLASATSVAASIRRTYQGYVAGKPWRTGGRWYSLLLLAFNAPAASVRAQATSAVVEIETATSTLSGAALSPHPHRATLENQTGWFARYYSPSAAAQDSSGNVWLAAAYRKRESTENNIRWSPPEPVGWNLYKLAVAAEDTFRAATVGQSALLAGGAPAWYDGATSMPDGFAHAPQILSVVANTNGSLANGTYSYRSTYSWVDAQGVLHRSIPSPPVTITIASTTVNAANVCVKTASLSGKLRAAPVANAANPVMIELWRTCNTGTGPHYRLTYEPDSSVLINDPRLDDMTLTDVYSDASIGTVGVALNSLQQLYTDLGELENVPPPSFITCVTHRGRIAGIGPDLRTVWLSKDSTLDTTLAPGFNEALTLAFTSDKTALASLDTVLVVFGKDKIDVVHGDGPDDKGDQNTWQIQAVQTDVGCVNPRSVVACPMGVIFESRRGLELLDRGLSVESVLGRNVVDTLAAYPTITSAVLVAAESEVRFTCDDGTNGIVLAYDYLNKIWFTRKYNDGAEHASVRFVDAALINGVYSLLTAAGLVMQETSASFRDVGSVYVETDIVLAPISAQMGSVGWGGDNMAWQRVKDLTLMGTSIANHNLAVSFAHNYANTYSQTHTFIANSEATAVGVRELARVTCALQKCQSIQIRIRDLTPTGSANGIGNASAGVTLESLCLRIAPKEGAVKTSAGQQG